MFGFYAEEDWRVMNVEQVKAMLTANGLNPDEFDITVTGNTTWAVPKNGAATAVTHVFSPWQPANQRVQILRVAVTTNEP